MRRSTLYLAVMTVAFGAVLALVLHAQIAVQRSLPALGERAEMVRHLSATDLCIFTEARYTRHPSQSDLHTAFQDHPLSLEHFPSGSLLPPPQPLKERYEPLD